jgi:RNA polymerase sigma-70 factor (ECF subfamily)
MTAPGVDFERSRRRLFGLAYRMTGSAADAEDVVQETFLRALSRAPDAERDLEPWLVTVALNVSRDRLQRRKREIYKGPWLPSPIDASEVVEPASPDEPGTEARYSMLESVSFAFLLALEALTPLQRAVLIMRDVLEYSARDTAQALDSTEGAVKVQLMRARRRLADYEGSRSASFDRERVQGALAAFLGALTAHDADAVVRLLCEDAVLLNDANREFAAAGRAVFGPANIARAMIGIAKKAPPLVRFELRELNGLLFVVAEQDSMHPRIARDFALACELAADGRIKTVYTVLATPKLTGKGARLG